MPSVDNPQVVKALILGTDALLAARPSTPVQLARACMRLGYDFVAPVSWGEELLAMRVVDQVRASRPMSSIVVHCPFVAEALRMHRGGLPRCWFGVSPPVAAARYLRAAFRPRLVRATFVGGCPGAAAPDLDEVVLPEVLLSRLLEAAIVPDEQPQFFEEFLPPDRARYASLPGGVPDPEALMALAGAQFREAALATAMAVAPASDMDQPMVIDLESSLGCICGRDRFAAAQLEPARSEVPVVSLDIAVDLTDARVAAISERARPPLGRPFTLNVREDQAPVVTGQRPEGGGKPQEPSTPIEASSSGGGSLPRDRKETQREQTETQPPAPALRAPRVGPTLTESIEPWARASRSMGATFGAGFSSWPSASTAVDPLPPPEAEAHVDDDEVAAWAAHLGDEVQAGVHASSGDLQVPADVVAEDPAQPKLPEAPLPPLEVKLSPMSASELGLPEPEIAQPSVDLGSALAAAGPEPPYPPLREALDVMEREDRTALRAHRTRRAAILFVIAALTIVGSVYAASRIPGWVGRGQGSAAAVHPPRLPALEVTQPPRDTATMRADSSSPRDAATPRVPAQPDTTPETD